MSKKLVILVTTLWLNLMFISGAAAEAPAFKPPRTDAFEPAKCMFEVPLFTFLSPERLGFECGYVTVPEQHARPDGPKLRLEVAILPSAPQNPAPDPLFMAQGGPGGSSLEIFPLLALNSPIRAERDIVIFDQRGTLYSQPNLLCPELTQLTEQTIELDLSQEESDRRSTEAYRACAERLTKAGVNLAAYNSLENAADVEDVRLALGYGPINFYGVSYGTLLGLHLMRHFPASLRAVILDAVVPTQGSFLEQIALSANRAFKEVAQVCAQDTACNAAYPNLEAAMYQVKATLDKHPATIPVTDFKTGRSYRASVNGSLFLSALFTAIYEPSLIPTLPALVYNTRAGKYGQLATLLPLILFQPTFSAGMYQTVVCAEEVNFSVADMPVQGVQPKLADLMKEQNKAIIDICKLWQIPRLGPEANAPVVSDVPTLLLSGRFDPITPPAFAQTVAKTLRHAYTFTFPNTSHGAFVSNSCAADIVQEFLAHPEQAPDDSCIAAQPTTFDFPTPARLFITPVMGNMLQEINQGYVGKVGWLLLALAGLLTFYLVWPGVWLLRKVFNRPARAKQPPGLLRWGGPLLVIAVSGLAMILVLGLVGLVMSSDLSALFVGVPKAAALLFLIPPLLLLLTLAMLAAAVWAWAGGFWSLWRRIYYSLLTLAAILLVGVLAQWGMLRVFV